MNQNTLKATIIFEGDQSVGQRDEVYEMELPYDQKYWDGETHQFKTSIRRKITMLYNNLHQESICTVLLPGEKL